MALLSRAVTPLAILLLLFLAACGADDTGEDPYWDTSEENQDANQVEPDNQSEPDNQTEPPEQTLPPGTGDPPAIPVAITTELLTPQVMTTGDILRHRCVFLDAWGSAIEYDEEEGDSPPSSRLNRNPNNAFNSAPGGLRAIRTGSASVNCQAPDLGLTDPNPLEILIQPGPVHTTRATLSDYQTVAGGEIQVSCEAFDSYGNPIHDAEFNVLADTSGSGIAIDNDAKSISITTTGIYTFSCQSPGVYEMFPDTLEVLPDLPYELIVDLVPFQTVYRTGQIITLATLVQDRFGNEIADAPIAFEATPDGEYFGSGRFRFSEEGTYTLTAEVTGATHDDVILYEERQIVVNETGPSISCSSPADGAMVVHNPGSNLTFEGTAADENGLDQVFVNGSAVSFNSDGEFSATVQPRYGINFVDIVAQDVFGEESVRTCAFLVSNHWHSPTSYLNDAVALRLSQDAIDDGDFDGNIRSLNDLLLAVLNSDGLRQQIESQITAGNPYDPDFCGFDLYVNGFQYVGDPHITSLQLIGGGLRLFARLNDIRVPTTIRDGRWYCPGTYNPVATISYLELELTADIGLSGGLPSISLREVERVDSGSVSLSGGNWFSSAMYSAIASLFQGSLGSAIEGAFESAIVDNFDDLFTSLFESLDIDALGTQIDVPRLDGTGELSLDFGFTFSHANANSSRLLMGLGPRLIPASGAAHSIPTQGIIHPAGNFLLNPTGDTAAAAVHIALLNQALHSLWRGGLFHAEVGDALFGDDAPAGTSVSLDTRLPPVVVLNSDETATLMLGAMRLSIAYPGLFENPITLVVGATADTSIALNGDEISFADVVIDEFYFSPEEASITEAARDVLENFLQVLLQNVIDQSLNAALPALPIPSFTITPDLGQYGLPVGGSLGLVDADMEQTLRHLILRAEFGVQ